RLVISSGAFPMLWPSPYLATTKVYRDRATLQVPILTNAEVETCVKSAPKPQTVEPRPKIAGYWEDSTKSSWPSNLKVYSDGDMKVLEADGASSFKLHGWHISMNERASH